jgi:mRNA-degrading endonuclease RelE of RelBE toxin-antitoxin system
MHELLYTDSAREDLRDLPQRSRKLVLDAADRHLLHEPGTTTRNRKPLRPNSLAEWELRIGNHRIFYDLDADRQVVKVKAVGVKKHNRLLIRGQEYEL